MIDTPQVHFFDQKDKENAMNNKRKLIPILSAAAVAAFGVSMYAEAAVPSFNIQSIGRFEYDMNHDGVNEIVLDSADLRNLKGAITELDASTTKDLDALKTQVNEDLTNKINEVNKNLTEKTDEMNTRLTEKTDEMNTRLTEKTDELNQNLEAKGNELNEAVTKEAKIRARADKAIYEILGMSDTAQETDENGNIVEMDEDGNVTRVIRTEISVNGTVITVTRYDVSKNPEEFIDKVSFDTATGKATTKEGTVVDPIIQNDTPSPGQTTVIVVNGDGTKTTIVYAEVKDIEAICQYLKDTFGFTDEQLEAVKQLIINAINSGAQTKQEIINYITNYSITQEELNSLLEGLNAPSTDNEIGVTMDEVRAYLESLGYTSDQINNVINKYLTIAGLTEDEIRAIISAMDDPAADLNSDGLVTKEELIAYLNSLTDASGNPLYTAEEIARLAAAYINLPSSSEINNTYKVFNTTEVNNISTAINEKYDDTALRMQVQNVTDAHVSVLDKIESLKADMNAGIAGLKAETNTNIDSLRNDMNTMKAETNANMDSLKDYVNHGGTDTTYDGVRAKYTPKTNTSPAMVVFSPINP